MDEDVIAVLNTHFYNRNILEILHEKRDQLKKRVYNILIAGKRRCILTPRQDCIQYDFEDRC
jgi:hypothetical protein